MAITITEMQIITCWSFTDTTRGCDAFIETMSHYQREAFSFGDLKNVELINDACWLALAKRDLVLSETVH